MMKERIAWRFALSVMCIALAGAQDPGPAQNGNLELAIRPEAVPGGMPQSFSFLLRNKTGHDVRIPVPTFKCGDAFNGSIELHLRFTPKLPGSGLSVGSGCAGHRIDWPPIMQRITAWQVLPAGDALVLKIDPKDVVWKIAPLVDSPGLNVAPENTAQRGLRSYWYDDSQSGMYEFWATYSLPLVSDSDQTKLRKLSIDFPRSPGGTLLSTAPVVFIKDK